MLNSRFIILCTLGAFFATTYPAANIVLYLQPAPYQATSTLGSAADATREIEALLSQQPSHLSAKLLEGSRALYAQPAVGGFLSVYNGYGDFSNADGLLTFPLRHLPASKLYVLVSPDIELVRAQGNTVAYARLPDAARDKAVRYEFAKSKDSNGTEFWHVTQAELPASGRITGRTLTMVTEPQNIVVIEGSFPAHSSGHMILPRNMYVVGARQQMRLLLSALDLLRFHEPIEFAREVHNEKLRRAVMVNQ